jgi:hypothetical protein
MKDRTDAQIRKIAKRRALDGEKAMRTRYRKGARAYKSIKSAPEPTND